MKARVAFLKSTIAAALLIVALICATACGSQQAASSNASSASSTSASASDAATTSTSASGAATASASASTSESADAQYESALSGTGLKTAFIGEHFYDKKVATEEDALAAVQSVVSRIGGDETTKLELLEIRPTETGTTYYAFRQRAGDVVVHGACVKLVVDKDGTAVGLVSAILPNVKLADLESFEVSKEQAEETVLKECSSNGNSSAKIVPNATEQTLIALDDSSWKHRYAWLVYTNNYLSNFDVGYLAHYVSADGDYLYAIPVSEPGDSAALAGDTVTFPFDKMEQGTWSGTVTKHDGTTVDVTVPTLKNPETGDVVLADGKRKIVCADYAEFSYNDKISPRVQTDGKFADNEVLIYDTFIRVWDFYDSIGWKGPDGESTPSILQMDMVDQNGEVVHNAFYEGRKHGFQSFDFNRDEADGECVDVIGHEFTHCVTGTTMTSCLYINDPGAINEAMSDILGNLLEMSIAYDPNGAWLFGENEGEPSRSMKDPHVYRQPEFTWDAYYGPAVSKATEANDKGGVHVNMSLLSLISYKLDQAGMAPKDQFYFWMNVALAMTPSTDYPQLAQLLPWCMEQAGYQQYASAVKSAIEEGKLTTTEPPTTPPNGSGLLKFKIPKNIATDVNDMRIELIPAERKSDKDLIPTWAGANSSTVIATVPAGSYSALLVSFDGPTISSGMVLTESGWVAANEESMANPKQFTINSGETFELPTTGLGA